MLQVPIQELRDEQRCSDYLLRVLPPQGLRCPQGHPVPEEHHPHDRHREPLVDYRWRECGAVFNLFPSTVWSGSRSRCSQIVLILRGIAQGVPTQHLAEELGLDRSQLLERRQEIQQLLEQRLSPLAATRRRDRGR
jgi:hypothetical protein